MRDELVRRTVRKPVGLRTETADKLPQCLSLRSKLQSCRREGMMDDAEDTPSALQHEGGTGTRSPPRASLYLPRRSSRGATGESAT